MDKPKWEKLEEGAGDVQRVLGEEEEWERLPLLRLAVAFRALRLDRWREHRRGEYARLLLSLSSGRVGCAKNLKAVGQAAGQWWALTRKLLAPSPILP